MHHPAPVAGGRDQSCPFQVVEVMAERRPGDLQFPHHGGGIGTVASAFHQIAQDLDPAGMTHRPEGFCCYLVIHVSRYIDNEARVKRFLVAGNAISSACNTGGDPAPDA